MAEGLPNPALAAPRRVAELPAYLARVAPGPQRLLAPGPGFHRPRGQQEGRGDQGLPAARRQHAAVGGRPLPAQPGLRQRDRRGQAALSGLAGYGLRDPALHQGRGDLGVGQQRLRRRRAGRGAGLRRRRAHPGGARGDRHPAQSPARAEGAGRQRRGPDAASAGQRAPARDERRRVRRAVHPRQAGDLRLPRVPVADPPAHLPSCRARQPSRPRVHRGRHHDDAVRHGGPEQHGPVPPGDGRDRPGPGTEPDRGVAATGDGRYPDQALGLGPRARRGPARGGRLGLGAGPLARPMTGVLVVNAGSSSLKLRVLDQADAVTASADLSGWNGSPDDAGLRRFLDGLTGIGAAGHRVVHGGRRFTAATLIDDAVLAGIGELTDLAPLHQPRALAGIAAVRAALPRVPAVACFDTAFHAGLPPAAASYAVPGAWTRRFGLRRFGFHGLSHAYAARRAAQFRGNLDDERHRVVTCHLGAGSSLAAVKSGRCVDTTMGFTPLEGLVMATRSGTVDPGLVLWLLRHGGLTLDEVSDGLEHSAGLAGLAELPGGSGDLRDVRRAAARGNPQARVAIEVHAHRLRAGIAAMAAALGGLDTLVFTGGIGEHQAETRAEAAAGLGFLGVAVDESRNATARPDCDISAPGAPVRTLVIAAREDIEVARQTRAVLAAR